MNAANTLSKGEFAAMMGVSPGRVSQWISEGKITADAMFGTGHRARIYPDVARQQVSGRTDPGQRFGNGLPTALQAERAGSAAPPPADQLPLVQPARNTVADQIAATQLEKLQQQVRKGAEEERARRGIYTPTSEVRRALGRLASDLMTAIEGGLPEVANSLAAKFSVPNRDVLHELRAAFRQIRERAAAEHAARAAAVPETVDDEEDEREDEEAEAAGEDE